MTSLEAQVWIKTSLQIIFLEYVFILFYTIIEKILLLLLFKS